MANYAYLRVSTDRQKTDSQRAALLEFCGKKGLKDVTFIAEKASGGKGWRSRKLANIVNAMQDGDTLVATEISRLGRSLLDVLTLTKRIAEINATVYLMREEMILGKNGGIAQQVMVQLFGMVAEFERALIRARVNDGIARAQARGVKFGRRPGQKVKSKLDKHADLIKLLYNAGQSDNAIGKATQAKGTTVKVWRGRNNVTVRKPNGR